MLSPAQSQQYASQGFLVVDQVFDHKAILAPLRTEYEHKLDRLCAHWIESGQLPGLSNAKSFEQVIQAVYAAGLDYFQPLDISLPPGDITADTPTHFGDAVFSMMTYPPLMDLVESVLGGEITSNPIQHVRIKPPSTQLYADEMRAHITSTHWHQDRAVTLEEADQTRMLTVWVAVNDATVENGCLQVIPGSHRSSMRTHCPKGQLAIPQNLFNANDAKPLPVKAGGVVLFDPLTIHSSLENHSDDVRWSFDLRYNVTGDPTGRPMFPEFIARSRKNPSSELRDPERWREMWRQTQQQLVDAPPVEIHRWPTDAKACA